MRFIGFHWILCGPLFLKTFRIVFGSAGLLVSAHAKGQTLDQDGFGPFADLFGQILDRGVYLQNIVSIHLGGSHTIADALVDELLAAELFGRRRAQSPLIVLHYEQHWELPYGRRIQGFVKIALAGPSVTSEDQNGFFFLSNFVRKRNAIGHAQLRAQMGDHSRNVVFRASKVETPVASVGKASFLSLELFEQAVERDSPRSEHAQIPVHGA